VSTVLQDVTRIEKLYRRIHNPQRHPENPVLVGDQPWERFASLYGTVLYDDRESMFKMWYLTGPAVDGWLQVRERRALGNITLLAYATSVDGVHWEKPMLGQLDFEGSTANNLIDIGRTNCEGIAVLYDEADPDPARRYKGFYWEHGGIDEFFKHESGRTLWGEGEGDGMWMSFSPDGVHWTDCAQNPVIPMGSDTTQSLVWDPRLKKYAAFGRFGTGGRRIGRALSKDAVHFDKPELVLDWDEWDEDGTQFYGMPLCFYEGMYLGMLWVYREGVDGTIDTALACSRDGKKWQRVLDRQTFLPLGPEGSWEDDMARVTQNVIVRGDKIYLYYGGVQGVHTGRKFKTVERTWQPALGLVTLRRDGFVSLDAGQEKGFMLTKLLRLDGGELRINVDAIAGEVVVAVTDDQGVVLEGFVSQPFGGDSTDMPVKFERSLSELSGEDVRLEIRLRQASLYSFWVG
jgi:hypothetical protein